jgi:hypothetical protein
MGARRRPVAFGQVAPLAAGPGEEEHRVDHLPARDAGWRATSSGRIKKICDTVPLFVGHLSSWHVDAPGSDTTHADSMILSSAIRPRIEHGGSGGRLELDRLGSTSQAQHSPSEADPQDEHRRHRGRDQEVAAYEVNECVGAGDGPANGTGNEQERARHPGPLASVE